MGGSEKERVFVSKESVYQSRVLADFRENRINRRTAAGLLNLSERQVSRLSTRFEKGGLLGIQHKTLGTKSNRATEEKEVKAVRSLFTEKYVNFNYNHFKEMLARFEGIELSYSTVRRILKDLNMVKRPRKLRKVRRYRARKASAGLLLQMDGSDHEWVRGAGKWSLIAGIDDATSTVPYGEFFPTETLEGYTTVLTETFAKEGIPRAVYVDCASWLSGTTQAEESGQFKRMCKELNMHPIYAESAQAKGRIERLWGTFQDRLIAELGLRNIKTMSEATRYLNEEFLPHWNKNFTVKPSKLESLYQKAPSPDQLKEIFALKFERKIRNDETIHWKNHLYQSMHNFGYSIAKRSAEVRVYADGSIRGFYGGRDLELKKLKRIQDDPREEFKTVQTPLAGLKINFARGDFLNKKSFK
jgi:transposase